MSAWKSHGRGTPVLRMSFKGIGQIERATGFHDQAMLPRLKEMCRTLYEAGKDELLRDIKLKRLTLRQVWVIYRTGQWARLPTPQHALPFADSFERWCDGKPSPRYRRFARWARTALARVRPATTLGELRDAVLHYRTACESQQHGAVFNRVHTILRAFLRDTVTTEHALYQGIASVPALPELVKRPKGPQRPEQAVAIREALGGELGRVWWTLCCTGMLPDEFFAGKWAVEDGRLHVKGTKREARDRHVPLLCEPVPPLLTQNQFQRALRLSGLGVRPKDGRDTFALWCDMAGLPQGWKRALMGHRAVNVTQEYGWQASEELLEEAEEKLGALLNPSKRVAGHSGGQPSSLDAVSADPASGSVELDRMGRPHTLAR